MKNLFNLFKYGLLGLLFSTTVFASSTSNQNKNAQLLFVMLAKHGAIQVVDKQKQTYQVSLKNVNPEVVYFSNRPIRESGHVDLTKFLNAWKNGSFVQNPPNGVMEAVRLNAENKPVKTVSYAIVLTNPSYDKKNNEIHFDAKPLPGNPTALPDLAHSDYVAVFIDSYCLVCIGG